MRSTPPRRRFWSGLQPQKIDFIASSAPAGVEETLFESPEGSPPPTSDACGRSLCCLCCPASLLHGCPKPGLRHGGAAGGAADCTCAGCPEPLCRAGLPERGAFEVFALPDRSLLQQGLPGDALESWPFEGVPGGAGRSSNPSRRRRARAPGPAPPRIAARRLRRRGGQDARPSCGV